MSASARLHQAASHTFTVVVALLVALLPALLGGPGLPRAAAEPDDDTFLQIRIDTVDPAVVATGDSPVVTVSGTVDNVGDRPVRDVVARLEHAPAVTTPAALRTDLVGDTPQFAAVDEFVTLADQLERGQSAPFTFRYPLRASDGPQLQIDKPGIYPLLVNVNGTPDYGDPARLDVARFLLPVVGVPADPDAANGSGADLSGPGGVVAPDIGKPVGLTMLWPLGDRPRLAPGVPGGTTPVRLMDDELATSLAPGGRLDTLLAAADFATRPDVDPDGRTAAALCLAVDPDLLVTVNAMTGGYVVADSPDGLGSESHPGTGQAAATDWLNRLRDLAGRLCVIATPYAQTDLHALQRVGDPQLASFATLGATALVDQILGVTSLPGATLIGDGELTAQTAELLAAQGNTVAITAPNSDADDDELRPQRVNDQVVAAPFDPAVAAALAGLGNSPTNPAYLNPDLEVPDSADSSTARRQNALGAMLWRSLQPTAEPRTELMVPPLTWDLSPDDAQAVLSTLATTIRSGLALPRPLPAVVAEAAGAAPGSADLPDTTQVSFNDGLLSQIAGQVNRVWGLTAALATNDQTGLTGVQYTAPLREDMLRALSQAEPVPLRNRLAAQRLAAVTTTIGDLFGAVTIVNPGGSYTLATERSPLPLALRNDLAVPIRVRLVVDAPPGMTVTDVGEQMLPPGYLPLRVPIEVHFTQRVAVDVALSTPDGLPLGEPVRLSVHSNAYGKVLFFITLAAGLVLVTLTGRRLWHRFRGQPDRADLYRPDRREP